MLPTQFSAGTDVYLNQPPQKAELHPYQYWAQGVQRDICGERKGHGLGFIPPPLHTHTNTTLGPAILKQFIDSKSPHSCEPVRVSGE